MRRLQSKKADIERQFKELQRAEEKKRGRGMRDCCIPLLPVDPIHEAEVKEKAKNTEGGSRNKRIGKGYFQRNFCSLRNFVQSHQEI